MVLISNNACLSERTFYHNIVPNMGNLFGRKQPKKPADRVTDHDRAVLQLKQQRDKLKQYQKKIEVQLEHDKEMVRKLLHEGKKDKAKLMLRKKKFQESLLDKTYGQLDNLEKLVQDLEFAQIEQQVVKGLEAGNAALKKMHEILSLDDVERIMEETKEGIAMQQEIDSLLAGGLSQEDEDDVLAELDELLGQGEGLQLPEVPTDHIGEERASKQRDRRKEVKVEAVPAT